LCVSRPYLVAYSGLPGDLTQNTFPVTPPGNENIGRGTRAPSESGFKAGKNLLLAQSAAGEILRKEKNIFFK
jgi:hypothetical protein